MTVEAFSRRAYPAAMAALGLLVVAWPIVRLRLGTGVWAVTFLRNRDPVARAIGVALTALVGGIVAWAFAYAAWGPAALGVWPLPAIVPWTGWGLAALGVALVVGAQAQMGASWRIGIDQQHTPLVTTGLYTWCRNPIYAGLLQVLAGFAMVSPSPVFLALALAGAAAVAMQTRLEERHLQRLHGEAFACWAARTGRFVPFLGRLPGDAARACPQSAP